MSIPMRFASRRGLGWTLAALALLPFGVAAENAPAVVYRCEEPSGAVLYADYACTGGAVVDIRPGSPAPDATQRLQRARDELDRAAARREANEAMLARREQLYPSDRLADAQPMAPQSDYGSSYGVPYGFYGYGTFAQERAHAPRTNRGRGDHARAAHDRGDRGRQGRLPAAIAPPTRSAIMRR
jgi:hypothetical protein